MLVAASTPARTATIHPPSVTIRALGLRGDPIRLLIEGEILLSKTLLKIEDLLSELVDSLLVRLGLRIETLELLVLLEQVLTNPLGFLPLLLAKLFELLKLVGAQLGGLRAIPAFSVTGAIASIVWAIP
jgi:hypothetical protein